MSEAEAIDRVESPAMTTTLQGDLVALGVAGGEPLSSIPHRTRSRGSVAVRRPSSIPCNPC